MGGSSAPRQASTPIGARLVKPRKRSFFECRSLAAANTSRDSGAGADSWSDESIFEETVAQAAFEEGMTGMVKWKVDFANGMYVARARILCNKDGWPIEQNKKHPFVFIGKHWTEDGSKNDASTIALCLALSSYRAFDTCEPTDLASVFFQTWGSLVLTSVLMRDADER